MGNITRHEYKTMEEWLRIRTSLEDRLGGSDLGVAAGHSPYKSAYSMFCERVGLVQAEDISEKEAIIQGHDLEQYVADRFTRLTGKSVHQELCIFTNSDAPHLKASIDRKVDGEDSGLECKTVKDIVMRKFPQGDFPQTYYDQCACYLKVTELKRWYLSMLVFGTAFKVFLMTTIKDEEERYNVLKLKIINNESLTESELNEWNSNYAFLESCYYIGKDELDGCETIASKFIGRCQDFVSGNGMAWPIDEIDGSEATTKTLQDINPTAVPNSVVTFDEGTPYGIDTNGDVFTEVRRDEVQKIAERRVKVNEVKSQLEDEIGILDNKMALLMKDIETFELPGVKITNKKSSPRKYGCVEKIIEYFRAMKLPVPSGMITCSNPSRSVRFYPHKDKSSKTSKK